MLDQDLPSLVPDRATVLDMRKHLTRAHLNDRATTTALVLCRFGYLNRELWHRILAFQDGAFRVSGGPNTRHSDRICSLPYRRSITACCTVFRRAAGDGDKNRLGLRAVPCAAWNEQTPCAFPHVCFAQQFYTGRQVNRTPAGYTPGRCHRLHFCLILHCCLFSAYQVNRNTVCWAWNNLITLILFSRVSSALLARLDNILIVVLDCCTI